MAEIKSLQEREGEMIAAIIPMIHKTIIQKVRLHRVEDSGLWVESQTLNNHVLEVMGAQSAPKSLVFFLPWHQVTWIMDSIEVPAITLNGAKL